MLLEVALAVIVSYFLYHAVVFVAVIQYNKRQLSYLPGPPSLPIVGSLPYLDMTPEGLPKRMIERTNVHAAAGADMTHMWIFHLCFAQPLNGPALKAILDSNEEITKGTEYDSLLPWLGRGLLTSTGERWKHRRRLITPTFHFQMLESYITAMNRHAKVFVDDILVDKCGTELDLYPFIKRCTLDIICETAMGAELNLQRSPDHPYAAAVSGIISIGTRIAMQSLLWTRPMRIILGVEQEYKKHVKSAHAFTRKVIAERMALIEAGEVEKNKRVFLDILVSQMGQEKLSLEDLREEVDTFMFEGFDMTASGLAWIVWCLACNPVVQEQAFQEIMDVMGPNPDRSVDLQQIHQLSFLERCIKETFRIFPPVPMVMRKLQREFKSGRHTLPVGTTVSINPMAVHRNEQTYPKAFEFDPDRFLPERVAERHPYDYIPFSAGPRNCIGQKFAMYEEKVIVSWLLRRYRFETKRTLHSNPPLVEGILRPKLGCLITVVAR